MKNNRLIMLFLTFLKIGAFTFGGGYAMIPLIQEEIVKRKKWITDDDILEIVAIAESTPGPIAINMATFVGYKVAGIWGAALSTVGVVLPSFVIISIIAKVLAAFESLKIVGYAFNGIRAGVLALIVKAAYMMFSQCDKGAMQYIIMGTVFLAVTFLGLNILIAIVLCGLTGLMAQIIRTRKNKMGDL